MRSLRWLALGLFVASTALSGPQAAAAEKGYKHYTKKGAFEDVLQDLKDVIINRGLVIDYVGNVNSMLERTAKAAGSVTETGKPTPYVDAKYLQFCSAKLTHAAVSANPFNLAICPYVIFIFEAQSDPGKVVIGYRRPLPRSFEALAQGLRRHREAARRHRQRGYVGLKPIRVAS